MWANSQDTPEATPPAPNGASTQPTGEIGDGNQAFLDALKKGLDELRAGTPDFRVVCNAIADAIDDVIDPTDTDPDPTGMIMLVTANVTATMNTRILSEDGLRKAWQEGYDKLIGELRSGSIAGLKPETSKDWIVVYRLATSVLRTAATSAPDAGAVVHPAAVEETPPAGRGISEEEAFAEENLVDRVVHGMYEFQLTKDTSFQKTCTAIIRELEQLRHEVKDDLDTMSGEPYLTSLRQAFKDGISDRNMGKLIRQRWIESYNRYEGEFVKEGDKDDPKTWDHAAVLLITALNKAIGIDKEWEEVAKDATPSASGMAAQSTGTVDSGGISPHTARKIRRIRNRAAAYRARTQAIWGR